MQEFRPSRIFIDLSVKDKALTQRVLQKFPDVPVTEIEDVATLKKPRLHTLAKRDLLITRHKGQVVKSCQGLGDYVCCNLLTISLSTNCHFECSYCILQDYLKNNPIMTFYANVDEILADVDKTISKNPNELYRIGTGELADSLALDPITGYSAELIPFAASRKNLVLELKTKSNCVDQILDLNHNGKTVVSWSVNPQKFIEQEELKTASLEARLTAAKKCVAKGYWVGFHLDPLLHLPNWEHEYKILVETIAREIPADKIAWISLGSLRYTPDLDNVAKKRFPRSKIFYDEMVPTTDGKVRYFKPIREQMYQTVKKMIEAEFKDTPHYLCMETETIWKKIFGKTPETTDSMEKDLAMRFAI